MAAIKGLENLQLNVKKLEKLRQAFGEEFLNRVKQKTPVLTGQLEESWELVLEPDSIGLQNDATNEEGEYYALYVEYGTYKMAGTFMVSSTMLEAQDILQVAKKNVGL
jgi:hypothetical protein